MEEKTQERREFVVQCAAAAAALASVGIARTAEAQKETQQLQLKRPVALNRANLIKLSNKLHSSPAERQKFLADPARYAGNLLGGQVGDVQKLEQMKDLFASGFCCGGCGC